MSIITVYHSTNVSISDIGKDKLTMYFTDSIDLARMWGDEHYDKYDIIATELPISSIVEFKPLQGREQFAVIDFEKLEVSPFEGEIIHYVEANHGYIVKNVNDYKLYKVK